jgi:hypothetical protein
MRQYFVLATEPLGAQALLNPRARAWLLAHPGLHLESGGSGVLVYRPGQLLAPNELDGFAREAADLMRLLEQEQRTTEKSPTKPSAVDEVRAFAAQMRPWAARSMENQSRARLVSPADVDAFLRQTPPRKIPSNIAHRCDGSRWIALIGAVFVTMMGLMAPISVIKADWGGTVFLSLFFLAGSLMLFFGGRGWLRQRSLLRRGELATAKIVRVESTGRIDSEKGEVFNMSARYQAGGQAREGRGKVWGRAGYRAKKMATEGKTAAILYDPAHPERILLVDALVNPPSG